MVASSGRGEYGPAVSVRRRAAGSWPIRRAGGEFLRELGYAEAAEAGRHLWLSLHTGGVHRKQVDAGRAIQTEEPEWRAPPGPYRVRTARGDHRPAIHGELGGAC